MKRMVMFFTMVFFSVSVLQAGNAIKKAPEKGLLKMTIISSTGNKALSGVKITAKMGKRVFTALTDKKGYAQLSLPAGTWKVSLSLKGWQPQSSNVKIESGRYITYKIKLYPAGSKPGGTSWVPSSGGFVPGRF
ncbi:MAG: carboxypeptidase regulatory-like domain-containing protein [Acidobacteria bacterium]|nr:carboxypeptidase regulatory-like domain-containing protein [Acidobacteriota bacterium]